MQPSDQPKHTRESLLPEHPWLVRQTRGGAASLLLSDVELTAIREGLLREVRRPLRPQPPLFGSKTRAMAYPSPTAKGCWNFRAGERGALSNLPLVCPFGEAGQLIGSRGFVLPLVRVEIGWKDEWFWRLTINGETPK